MTRAALLALLLLAPFSAGAATMDAARSLVVSEPVPDNAYLIGGDVTVAAPVARDLTAAGGTLVTSVPLTADAMLAGGTVDVRRTIAGDLRALGGRVRVGDVVSGDLTAIGGTIEVLAPPAYAWLVGGNIRLSNGASGPVVAYGTRVLLAGEFAGDVDVTVSDELIIADGTVIRGTLRYNAPQETLIPTKASFGGLQYTGSSYLPTTEEAQNFALLATALFFLVRILAGLIAAGVLAGLFPRFAQAVADEALSRSLLRFLLLTLLGFGIMVAAPVLIVILLLSFAGAAVALVVLAAYFTLLLIGYFFSAVIAGAILARAIAKRTQTLWRDAVFGMLALSIITLVPVAGWTVFLILFAASVGAITLLFYRWVFGAVDEDGWTL